MEYSAWSPFYERIAREFGFEFDREERSAARLETRLPPADRADPLGRSKARLSGRDVIVAGLAPRAGPPPIWRLASSAQPPAVVAADGATAACLDAGIVPAVIVTDLDGPLPTEVNANRRGSLVVVHAHGDNFDAIDEWVPQFPGELAGSWAGPPRPSLLNVGGFTDGDRSAFLAEACGARRILLWGFDFESVEESDPRARDRKLAKLAWAKRLLAMLARDGSSPVLEWHRDGSLVPYPVGSDEESTR
jgi:2-amino-4-hydroxy-6-hydroxymethyldihydropteridine diphosphokinase